MAIFNFVKQAGQIVSDSVLAAADAATDAVAKTTGAVPTVAVQAKITTSGIKPRDLSLKMVDEETIKIYAIVDTVEEKEELILLAGNTPGVAKVEDAVKVKPEGAEEVSTGSPNFYTVAAGDTLNDIAQRELGDGERFMEIFQANRNTLSDPNSISVGQTLRIPKT